jgi:flagella basal body P-ring formation protein FlgA
MKRLAAVIFLIVCVLSAFEAGAVTVSLNRVVYYAGSEVKLADLARVDNADYLVMEKILGEKLGARSGLLHIIPQRMVRDLIAPYVNDPIVIAGNKIFLIPESATAAEKRFFVLLLEFIEAGSSSGESRMEIEVTDPVSPGLAGAGAGTSDGESFRFGFANKKTRLGFPDGAMRIEYTPASTGITDRFGIIVRSFVPVLKALDAIGKDEILSSDMFTFTEAEVSSLESDVLGQVTSPERFRTKSGIRAGSIVYAKQVEQVFDVKARDQVRLVFRKGSILITMAGYSSESGIMGEPVKVKTFDTDKLFTGKITGKGEVTVDVAAN